MYTYVWGDRGLNTLGVSNSVWDFLGYKYVFSCVKKTITSPKTKTQVNLPIVYTELKVKAIIHTTLHMCMYLSLLFCT